MSMDLTGENIAQLKKLFPEAVTEGKIDFEVLKALLGGEIEQRQEYYKFTWNGKEAARAYARTRSMGTLRPCVEESSGKDGTPGKFDSENLYIEGDNLEVLKLLQGAYHKKVKMIYIDPPYNTGKDFVYPDNYRDSIKNYKELTGQTDAEGKSTRANPETSGRYHTDWLNMMYPRLILARNLLTDDGVIFISIDDVEVANLRKLCDNVFGEENFEGHIHWRRRHNQPNDKSKMIGLVSEHILAYARSSEDFKRSGVGKLPLTASFTNPDNDPKGPWASKPWKVGSDQSGSRYKITTPTGIVLDEEWMGDENTYNLFVKEGRIYFPKGGDGMPRKKYYQFEREEEGQCATNWWPHETFGHNQGANDKMTELFGKKNIFSNPKPIELLSGLIKIANVRANDIVLDFFSGSATIAHALFLLNIEFLKKRHFICVQLPEPTYELIDGQEVAKKDSKEAYETGYKNICEIGKERIRRAAKKIREENPLACQNQDMGFKVFKLDTSNLLPWNPSAETLEDDLYKAIDNMLADRSTDDLLYEILLKCNLPLTLPIEKKQLGANTVYIVGMGALAICLDKTIPATIAEEIVKLRDEYAPIVPMQVVFRDTGFDDVGKANALQILKQAGFEEKSIQTI